MVEKSRSTLIHYLRCVIDTSDRQSGHPAGWLVGWPTSLFAGWLAGWWLAGWLAHWLADWVAGPWAGWLVPGIWAVREVPVGSSNCARTPPEGQGKQSGSWKKI